VGRFVNNQRSKRQDILIDAFKILIDNGSNSTLKLVGFVQDAEYLAQLKIKAGEYPIEFISDASEEDLNELYQSAVFYWHACGFGVDASSNPGRVEHFGIAVADALTFGCIPFVYGNGGPSEIVDGGKYGFVWETPHELANKTIACINSPELKHIYQEKAIERSHLFSKKMFADSLKNIKSFHIN
jgi:glycosyltransferase involved in cell wall biosynthesis